MSLPKPYYQAESITLYQGDCREILPALSAAGPFADMVVVDPPYKKCSGGCSTRQKNAMAGKLSMKNPLVRSGKLFKHNELRFEEWMPLAFECLKDATHAYFFSDYRNSEGVLRSAREAGFFLANCRPMLKNNFVMSKYGGFDYELIWMFRKGRCRLLNDCGVRSTIPVEMDRMTPHPTQKPLGALLRLLMDSSLEDDTVLDCCAGSGTTLVAAKMLGRQAVGIEIDERWCEEAARRLDPVVRSKTDKQGILFL